MTASPECPRAHLSQTRSLVTTVPGQAFTFLTLRATPWAAGSVLFCLDQAQYSVGFPSLPRPHPWALLS